MRYVDTSAFLKLLVAEEHSDAFAQAVSHAVLWSSQLLAVEAHRAALRLRVPPGEVDTLLTTVSLVLPAATTFHRAQSMGTSCALSMRCTLRRPSRSDPYSQACSRTTTGLPPRAMRLG